MCLIVMVVGINDCIRLLPAHLGYPGLKGCKRLLLLLLLFIIIIVVVVVILLLLEKAQG